MADDTFPGWHGTTIIGVKKGAKVVSRVMGKYHLAKQ